MAVVVVLVFAVLLAVVVTGTVVLHWLPVLAAVGNGGGALRALATA